MAVGLVTTFLVACGSDSDEEPVARPAEVSVSTATSVPEDTPTPEVIASPTPAPPTPTQTPTTQIPTPTPMPSITDEELAAVAEAIFPDVGGGIYVGCDTRVDLECPISGPLRLHLDNTDAVLCRCQNASDSREIEVLPERLENGGGIVRVTMYQGNTSYDLVVVPGASGWVLDDIYCAARPETSIHQEFGPC